MKTAFLLVGFLVLPVISLSKSETKSALSITKLINYLHLNADLVEHLDNYIRALDEKLKIINEALVDLATFHIQNEHNKLGIVSSSAGSFSLIHHMATHWNHWQAYLEVDPGRDEFESLISKKKYLPSKEDVKEVCQGISRIINAYDLLPRDGARGVIFGVAYKFRLSPRDCLLLADYSFAINDFNKAQQWVQLAISLPEDPANPYPLATHPPLNSADLHLKLAEIYVKQNKWLRALETVESALKTQPRNAKLLRMHEYLSSQILLDPPSSTNFKLGNKQYLIKSNANLYCFYHNRKGSPYTPLSPIKAEVFLHDPLTVLYHE